MDVELLKTFIEVQQTRHFGRAAENLFITQSAVSARIRQLEDALGVRLFMRDRNNIQLTTAGRKLLQHAESIVAGWNRARLDVAVDDDVGQSIAMAATPNLWDILMPEWLRRVSQQHGRITLNADSISAELIIRRVLDCALDFGFVLEPPRLPELAVENIGGFRLQLVSSGRPTTLAEALAQQYIYVDWGGDFSYQHARLLPAGTVPAMRIGVASGALQLLLTEPGRSAYLAEPLVAQAISDGALLPVADAPVMERRIYAIYRQDTDRQAFIRPLLELAGRLMNTE